MSFVFGGNSKIAIVLVGLPARGKTYIGQKISRYLRWLGVPTRIFNVGDYRRKHFGAVHKHDFFDTKNEGATKMRLQAAEHALQDMIDWFTKENGQIAIYDATNNMKDRRKLVKEALTKEGIEVMFIESICEDEEVVMTNIKEVKVSSPDYQGENPEEVITDFLERINHYKNDYEPLDEKEGSFIKMINVGSEFIIHRIKGYLQSRVCYYVMNLHITPRYIYMTRHGESEMNVLQRIGGDSELSENGRKYAQSLPEFFLERFPQQNSLTVWTSTLKRTIQTGEHLPYPKLQWKALDEIDAGVCDGLTYEEIEERFPADFAARDDDKFNYRYRAGESYRDLVLRLEPVIMELERQTNILIIGHQAVLRAIYAYFLDLTYDELPYIHIPLHTVVKFTPKAYRTEKEEFKMNIKAVDTHRDPRQK